MLYLTGYERPTLDDIERFRQLGSPTAGHPENFELPGVEVTTGPLGQGVAMAVGMAIAERHLNAIYGDDLVDHRTFVIAGDGCLMEGINHEAIGLAGTLGLGRLIVLWDDNSITIDGSTELSRNEDVVARHRAAQWHVVDCDGLDADDVSRAIAEATADPRPSLIRCRTIIGFGAPNKQGTAATHGSALGKAEVEAARAELGLDAEEFSVPEDVLTAWRSAGKRGSVEHALWSDRLESSGRKDELLARAEREGEQRLAPPVPRQAAPRFEARRDPQSLGNGARGDQYRHPGDDRRLGRSHRLQQHQDQEPGAADGAQLRRPLHLLRHPRVRDGRGDERNGAARRRHSLWRDVPGLHRLRAPRDPPVRSAERPRHLRHDPRLRSDSARMVRPTSRSSICRACA